jgi:hypothetical protein
MVQVLRWFRRWWNRFIGLPARLLMRVASRGQPQDEYHDIRFIVTDRFLLPNAERFFERTRMALDTAESRAPQAYEALRKDVQQVFLWGQTDAMPYNRFQLAAVVSPRVALEADTMRYAAWLLYTSGLLYGRDEAQARSEELLASLEPDGRGSIAAWLRQVIEHEPPDRTFRG